MFGRIPGAAVLAASLLAAWPARALAQVAFGASMEAKLDKAERELDLLKRDAAWHDVRRQVELELAKLGDVPVSAGAAPDMVRLLTIAGRGKEALPFCLAFLREQKPRKPFDPRTDVPRGKTPAPIGPRDLEDPKKLEKVRKELENLGNELGRVSEMASADLEIQLTFSNAIRFSPAADVAGVLSEGERIFDGKAAFMHLPGMITAWSLLRSSGVAAEEVNALVKRYATLLGAAARKPFEQAYGLLGDPAPTLRASQRLGGGPAALDDLRGMVVVLHFFENPTLEPGFDFVSSLLANADRDRLAVIGVTHFTGVFVDARRRQVGDRRTQGEWLSTKEETALLERWRGESGISWPWWIDGTWLFEAKRSDKRPQNLRSYRVGELPTFVVLDREAKVRHIHEGLDRLDDLKSLIEKAMAEPAPSTPVKK